MKAVPRTILIAAIFCQVPNIPADETRPPNVVLLIGDDLGYGELGCYGATEIPTPNLDSIAKTGVRMTSGYVSCPVCSPTRAGLLTGRYQQRFGHEFNPGPPQQANAAFGLPLDQKTIANYFQDAGYATGMVGKWHLGYKPEFRPNSRGFDSFFGFLGGAHSYDKTRTDKANPIYRNLDVIPEERYLTEAFAEEAVAFIEDHKAKPFFLYVPFNAVHNPLQAPEKYRDRFASIADPKRRTFAAMLSALDDAVGGILAKLREDGLEENTLVIFLTDNGGPTRATTCRNTPLRGFKGDVFEGGVRVPFLLQWKGKLPAGQIYDSPVIALDILPTALAAAGRPVAATAKLDGVNLLPFLQEASTRTETPHEALYWRFGKAWAIRQGDWKLEQNRNGPVELFNLAEDISESKDLSGEHPDIVKQLKDAWSQWDSQLVEPKWKREPRDRPRRRARPQS